MKKLLTVCLYLFALSSLLSLHASEQRPRRLWDIKTAADYERLRSKIAKQLRSLGQFQISKIEETTEKSFTPTEKFIQQQQKAKREFSDILPRITQVTKLPQAANSEETAQIRTIDVQKINKLSTKNLLEVLESSFQLLGQFPPLPAQADAWSKVFTPLLTFDKKARSQLARIIESWLDALLAHDDDIATLATLSKRPRAEQQQALKALRERYREQYNNVSQLFYTWIQASTVLNKENPLRAFLRHATTKPNALEKKFDQIREKVKSALEDQSEEKKLSPEDIDGIIMLSIASLFAPEAVWQQLGQKSSSQQMQKQQMQQRMQ